jgi:5-oxoprolinase (ATP-hydrolysing) subunit A
MSLSVDLNADLGEGAGHDEDILEFVSSANIACGFHAGDPASILGSIHAAHELEVAVGAHPSFPDRANFGRKEMALPPDEIYSVVMYQLGAFQALARAAGAEMNHVKAHGALYNMAARDRSLAEVIVNAVSAFDPKLILFVPPGGVFERAAQERGLQTAREVFADRNYMPDGTLVSRSSADAFVRDPIEAAERVIRMLREQKVRAIDGTDVPVAAETICVHGDNPEAVEFVQKLRDRLASEEVTIAAPLRQG